MTAPLTGAPWTPEPGAIVFLPSDDPNSDANVGFTADEAYAFLSGGVDAVTALNAALTAAAGDPHTGAMIAFIPSGEDLVELVVPDGESVDELHVTAYFLGRADDIDENAREMILAAVAETVALQPPIVASVFGFSVFNPDGPEPCLVATVGGVELEDAHTALGELLDDIEFELPRQHAPWVPHITLAYRDDPRELMTDELMAKTGPITFDRVRVAFGGVVTDFPLRYALTAGQEVFHLPGAHDQKAHGKGGVGSHATSTDVANAKHLNKGKMLDIDSSNKHESRLVLNIEEWTYNPHARGRLTAEGMRDPGGDTDSARFVRTIAAAPDNAPTLHRGLSNADGDTLPQKGDVFDMAPSSWTSDRKVASDFAGNLGVQSNSLMGRDQAILSVKKGSRSLRIDQHSRHPQEKEYISMGRYRVTKRTSSTVQAPDGRGGHKTVTLHEIELEQVNPDKIDINKQLVAPPTPAVEDNWDTGAYGW